MSQFSGNFPHGRTDGRTPHKGSIYRTLPPKEVGPTSMCYSGTQNDVCSFLGYMAKQGQILGQFFQSSLNTKYTSQSASLQTIVMMRPMNRR